MSNDNDIEKPIAEMPADLDVANTRHWGYGKYGDADYVIEHVQPDSSAHVYRIPRTIGLIIERERAKGAEEARREIRSALGL